MLEVTNVNSGAVDGSHALGLQSFMLSDIISSTVYGLAQSSLDPMYVSMVFPTVLSTGVVDMDQLIPFMDDITNNFGNISQLMSIFDGVDVNDIITGGVALNGSVPGTKEILQVTQNERKCKIFFSFISQFWPPFGHLLEKGMKKGGEPIGWVFIVATVVMAVGCWLAGR